MGLTVEMCVCECVRRVARWLAYGIISHLAIDAINLHPLCYYFVLSRVGLFTCEFGRLNGCVVFCFIPCWCPLFFLNLFCLSLNAPNADKVQIVRGGESRSLFFTLRLLRQTTPTHPPTHYAASRPLLYFALWQKSILFAKLSRMSFLQPAFGRLASISCRSPL